MKTYLKITIKLLIAVVFMASSSPILLNAQIVLDSQDENQTEFYEKNSKVYERNHSLMISLGSVIFLAQLSLQLDLNISRGAFYKFNGRFSGGFIGSSDYGGGGETRFFGATGLAFLIGKNKNFLDIAIGMKFADHLKYTKLGGNGLTGSISYRYEPENGPVINIGVGDPQLIFIAVGFKF